MAMSETGTSTSNPLGGEYQVFLSFRGPDTRRGFADVLHSDLSAAGIHVFIDDEEIRPGERIDGELLRAINDSRLYIPIFSPKYASSYWCLRELVMMVEKYDSGKDENKKVILPVFYDVKPDAVKLRTPLYENDIQKLEQTMKDKKKNFSSEDANTWRQALKTVGGISGLDLKNYTGDGHLSKSVVDEVVNRLQTRQREVTEDLVGMENQIFAINNLLDIDAGGVRLIGIYGMGGIGKTTLAQKIYNQLCPHFGKNCSFLDDIRETAKTKGLVELQEQLWSDISNSKGRKFRNDGDGIKAIEETICNKKVLVVLDDVDDDNQIRKLIGRTSLYPGTRILVTTRDSGVLNIRGLKYRFEHYELKRLSDEHALQLFSRHAFDCNYPLADYYTLSKGIVSTAGGLPLALQAIGASLFGQKKIKIWEEMLQKLKETLNKDVLQQLKISYDALETDQKEIFLDIACFLIGQEKTRPIYLWDDRGFSSENAIDVLTRRCVIKVLDNNIFWMHDQFRDLGRAIAKEGHMRLWDTADIIHELKSKEKKRSVQALCFRPLWGDPRITVIAKKEIERFPHLQFLWVDGVCMQGDFAGCLSKLKWLYLCPHSCLCNYSCDDDDQPSMPTNLHLENLVVLHIRGYEWTEDAIKSLIKEATKLKVLIIKSCHLTHTIPTFSELLVLEKLSFLGCLSLKKISCSIGKLRWLTYLEFENCPALEKLPEQIGELKKLQHLSLSYCSSLRELPDSVSKLESLTKLDLFNCDKIQVSPELPKSLTTLRLTSESLKSVPNISNLTNLVELVLSNNCTCHAFITQPWDLLCIGKLFKLRKLELTLSIVRATSIEWGSLSLLEELHLDGLDLQMLKQLPSSLKVLELSRTRVKRVELDGHPNLEKLYIKYCERVARISITSSLNKLRDVSVMHCPKLVELQFHGVIKSMERLHIWQDESLERLVFPSEEELGCNELQAPELTGGRRTVYTVSSSLKMLQTLVLGFCHKLQEIQFVSTLEALKVLTVAACNSLKRLGGLSNLKNLNSLCIGTCNKLQVVEGIDKLERLETLTIVYCRSVERISELDRIFESSSSKIPKECRKMIFDCTQLGSCVHCGLSITWEDYGDMILNLQTKAADSTIETTFPEIGDPLLEQQDDGDEDDDGNKDDGIEGDEDDEEDDRDDDDNDNVHEDYENDDGEDDEVRNVHSSRGSSQVCSEDQDDDDDGEDDEDNNSHEVLQSSHKTPLVYSVNDSDENSDVNKDGDSDSDGDSNGDEDRIRTRTRKRKRGMMKKLKRSKMTVMTPTTMKTTTRATTMVGPTTMTRTTLCSSIWSCLAGLCESFPWTTTMRRRKAKGEGQCDGDDKTDDEEAEEEVRDATK